MMRALVMCARTDDASFDRAEKRLRMRHLRAVGGSSAGKSRLEQQISNVKSIVERWRYFVYFLNDLRVFPFQNALSIRVGLR